MSITVDFKVKSLMNDITNKFVGILGDNLTGVYLHGSVAFGCYNMRNSDIDFIAVTKEPPTFAQKKEIIEYILYINDSAPPKGLEMSFVLEKDCTNFVYPTPYQLHFSNYHKPFYIKDIDSHINKLQGTDKDLTAHFTVINNVGITWYGKAKELVFSPVPKEYYMDSIKFDIENSKEDIFDNPVYIILNLCRVYAYMQNNLIISKKDGGLWGIENLSDYALTIEKAYNKYVYNIEAVFSDSELDDFASYMISKIFI